MEVWVRDAEPFKGFLKKAVNALSELSSTEEGGAIISAISSLDAPNVTIVETKGESKFVESDSDAAYANQHRSSDTQSVRDQAKDGGSGGILNWNTSGALLATTAGPAANATTDLIHELAHADDARTGRMNIKPVNGVSRNEWQATYRENIVRGQLRKTPFRTHYKSAVDPSGNKTGQGAGPSMIRSGKPYIPFKYNP